MGQAGPEEGGTHRASSAEYIQHVVPRSASTWRVSWCLGKVAVALIADHASTKHTLRHVIITEESLGQGWADFRSILVDPTATARSRRTERPTSFDTESGNEELQRDDFHVFLAVDVVAEDLDPIAGRGPPC